MLADLLLCYLRTKWAHIAKTESGPQPCTTRKTIRGVSGRAYALGT